MNFQTFKNVFEQNQKHFLCPGQFVSATNVASAGKRGNICAGNNVSLFARAFRARIKLTSNLRDILSEIRFNKSNYKLFFSVFVFSSSCNKVVTRVLGLTY